MSRFFLVELFDSAIMRYLPFSVKNLTIIIIKGASFAASAPQQKSCKNLNC